MLRTSDILKCVYRTVEAHARAGAAIPPDVAIDLCLLVSTCADFCRDMELRLAGRDLHVFPIGGNVVMLRRPDRPAPVPPTGGDAA